MKVDVFDTYVRAEDGRLMHFDVLLPDGMSHKATHYAEQWLMQLGIAHHGVNQTNCRFCHIEEPTPEVQHHIEQHGYFILQMEGCPSPS